MSSEERLHDAIHELIAAWDERDDTWQSEDRMDRAVDAVALFAPPIQRARDKRLDEYAPWRSEAVSS